MRIILDKVRHVYQEGSPFSAVALDNVNMTVEEGEFFTRMRRATTLSSLQLVLRLSWVIRLCVSILTILRTNG